MLQLMVGKETVRAPVNRWREVSAADAARCIPDGAVVAVESLSEPLAAALDEAYRKHARPRDLTIVYAAVRGLLRSGGLQRVARAGLIRRVIGGQWYPVRDLRALAESESIEAYSLPAGVIRRMFRDIAEGVSGHLSRSGLGTFADPRVSGGRLNRSAAEQLVFVVQAAGVESLLYRTFPVDVAFVSVAVAVPPAPLAMTRDALLAARAARASGGLVIAQPLASELVDHLSPRLVTVLDDTVDLILGPEPAASRLRRLTAR